jgi:hypothetical protein
VINPELNSTVFRTEQEGREERSKNYEDGAAFTTPSGGLMNCFMIIFLSIIWS